MTDEYGRETKLQDWLISRVWQTFFSVIITSFVVSVLSFIVATAISPVRKKAVELWNLPSAVAANAKIVEEVKEQLRIMSFPNRVFLTSLENSGPVDGYCVEEEPCQIVVRVRRTEEALSCRFVAGSNKWAYLNPRTDTVVFANRLDPALSSNLTTEWTDVYITIETPIGLAPESEFFFESSYTNCRGMVPEDEPITIRSDRDKHVIRKALKVSPVGDK